jgi:hypothetical protein
MWGVLERAIELAEAEHARLALAKTTDPGWLVRWFGPLAAASRGAAMITLDAEHQQRLLDCASAHVPASIPLTRVLLGPDTACAIRRLAEHACFDLLVTDEVAARSRRLRREIRRLELCTLAICPDSVHDREPVAGELMQRHLIGEPL